VFDEARSGEVLWQFAIRGVNDTARLIYSKRSDTRGTSIYRDNDRHEATVAAAQAASRVLVIAEVSDREPSRAGLEQGGRAARSIDTAVTTVL
jgi:hypothetical protein